MWEAGPRPLPRGICPRRPHCLLTQHYQASASTGRGPTYAGQGPAAAAAYILTQFSNQPRAKGLIAV